MSEERLSGNDLVSLFSPATTLKEQVSEKIADIEESDNILELQSRKLKRQKIKRNAIIAGVIMGSIGVIELSHTSITDTLTRVPYTETLKPGEISIRQSTTGSNTLNVVMDFANQSPSSNFFKEENFKTGEGIASNGKSVQLKKPTVITNPKTKDTEVITQYKTPTPLKSISFQNPNGDTITVTINQG